MYVFRGKDRHCTKLTWPMILATLAESGRQVLTAKGGERFEPFNALLQTS